MGSQAPEPQDLASWQDAFQYPIPTVRRVEQELRRDIASNKEKLRALVGTRYRDLLGTAETIVSMNRDIQEAESNLTDIGRRCNPRLIEKSYTHLKQIKGDAFGKENRSFGAQLAFLHRFTTSISKILRKRGSLLVIGKLWAVSRRLHKTLSQQNNVPPFLESLRTELISLRRHHLRRIEKRLASANSTTDDIIETLAAYCLVTNSSSDDAIRHFQDIREGVIRNLLDLTDLTGENVLKALRLYIQTLQTSKILYSRRLSDALGKLKSKPILADPEVRSVDDLDIDILGRWVAPEVSNFTPWIILGEWTKPEAEKAIKRWSGSALQAFVQGCQKSLAGWNEFSELLALRRKTLEVWLSSGSSTLSHSPFDVLGGIRGLFNGQFSRILHAQADRLGELARYISSITTNWENTQHRNVPSLWDSDLISFDSSNGAAAFKQVVVERFLGWNEDVSSVVRDYEEWLASIEDSRRLIDDLRRVRWIDILDDVENDDPDVDIPSMLSDDDPRILLEALRFAVKQAFDRLQSSFRDAMGTFGTSNQSGKARFFLRLIRQIRSDMPADIVLDDFLFSTDVVPELQNILVKEVITNAGPLTWSSATLNSHTKAVPGRTLWEGVPELPVQPLPSTFKFLRRLMASMEQCGSDLWDSSTVKVLKMATSKELSMAIISTLENLESLPRPVEEVEKEAAKPQSDGEEQPTENGDRSIEQSTSSDALDERLLRDRKIQLLFDTLYLEFALATGSTEKTELVSVIEKLRNDVDPEMGIAKHIQKTANGYWKRTELLFGLLAVRTE